MDVKKDVASSTSGTASASPASASFTIAANSNRALYVFVLLASGVVPTISSVNWNTSEALSLVGSSVTNTNMRGSLYRLVNPTATTSTITVSLSASADEWMIGWFSLYNVDQAVPEGTSVNNTGTAGTIFSVGFNGKPHGLGIAGILGGDAVSAVTTRNSIAYWVSSGTQHASAAVASLTVTNTPAGRQNGDLEIVQFAKENQAAVTMTGSGWTLVNTRNFAGAVTDQRTIAWRIYDGTNVDPAFSWTGAVDCWARRHCYRDTKPTSAGFDPMAVLGTFATGTTTTHTSTGGNTTRDNVCATYIDDCNANTAIASPASWTERWDAGSATGPSRTAGGDRELATAGSASGNISVTGGGTAWIQEQFELYPSVTQTMDSNQNNIGAAVSGAICSEAGDVFNALGVNRTGTTNEWIAIGVCVNPANLGPSQYLQHNTLLRM